jgi:hypothetical protein
MVSVSLSVFHQVDLEGRYFGDWDLYLCLIQSGFVS